MKRPIIAFFLMALSFIYNATGQDLRVMTYNLRVDVPVDSLNSWDHRKEALTALLRFYAPDIFGTQEGLHHQVTYIKEALNSYNYAGGGRTDGATAGEYSAIFYNVERFERVSDSTFWLSATPDKPSRGWDAAYDRICTYVLLSERRSGKRIWVFNTHLDNRGTQARAESARLIADRIRQVRDETGYPVILTGDFNCVEGDEPVQIIGSLLADSRKASLTGPYGPSGSFNGFETDKEPQQRIDYIFVTENLLTVIRYAVIDDHYDGRWPSDHLPVLVDLEFK